MKPKADGVRPKKRDERSLDDRDRMLLSLLAVDATIAYVDLGKKIALSTAAVHERVKRLKRIGVITGTVARLDGAKIGRHLLAFIHVEVNEWRAKEAFQILHEEPDVEEVHSVAGDACIIMKVRCADPGSLEELLGRVYAIKGVSGTRSYVVLSSYLERGPQA